MYYDLHNPILNQPNVPDQVLWGSQLPATPYYNLTGEVYGGGVAGTAYKVGKKVVTKAIPVIGAISTAKDVYDFGVWLGGELQEPLEPGVFDYPDDGTYEPGDFGDQGPY